VKLRSVAAGGIIDLYFFFGQGPNELIQSYQKLVGLPVLTPQWALGWNQCRWGYSDTATLREVVANYSADGLPLDT